MHVEFEIASKIVVSRPNRNNPDARWYIAEQPALMFKKGSKYPDKFDLTLMVTSDEREANDAKPFALGSYQLTEDAFTLDRNNNPQVDFTKIEPLQEKAKLAQAS
ncbi:MAG: hypothetical protein HRT92_11630 [Piscirickettsiaceae bacterium]|nr:hypothetical protein [Piscirickettsiaceae bacterium]